MNSQLNLTNEPSNSIEANSLPKEKSPTMPQTENKEMEMENKENKELEMKQQTTNFILSESHDIKNLFYLLNKNRISGPHTIDGIVSQYVYGQITSGSIHINPADGDERWYKLEFPPSGLADIGFDKNDLKHFNDHYGNINSEIKSQFPKLYALLVEKVMSGEIKQIYVPAEIPHGETDKNQSMIVWITRLLGKILLFVIVAIMLVHIAPLLWVAIIAIMILNHFYISGRFWEVGLLGTMLIGLVITPIIVSCVILFEFEVYDEIQSWMIAYITWGFATFALIYVFIMALHFVEDWRTSDKLMTMSTNVLLYIVGIDFGKMNIRSMILHSAQGKIWQY